MIDAIYSPRAAITSGYTATRVDSWKVSTPEQDHGDRRDG